MTDSTKTVDNPTISEIEPSRSVLQNDIVDKLGICSPTAVGAKSMVLNEASIIPVWPKLPFIDAPKNTKVPNRRENAARKANEELEMRRQYDLGYDDHKIADRIGLSEKQVSRVLRWRKKCGLIANTKKRAASKKPIRPWWTEEDHKRVEELVNKGYTDSEVSKITGIPKETICRWRLNGFKFKSRKEQPKIVRKIEPEQVILPTSRITLDNSEPTRSVSYGGSRGWSPNHPKFSLHDEAAFLETYLSGASNIDLSEYLRKHGVELSPKQSGIWAQKLASRMLPPLDVHRKLIKLNYAFRPSKIIAIDLSQPNFNNLDSTSPLDPFIFIVCDGLHPRVTYTEAEFEMKPATDKLAEVIKPSLEFFRENGDDIFLVVVDGAPELDLLFRQQILPVFPNAKLQLCHFHAKRNLRKLLPLGRGELRTHREFFLSGFDYALKQKSVEEFTEYLRKMRAINDIRKDQAVYDSLDYLEKNAPTLLSFRESDAKTRATSKAESIFSLLDTDWFSPKHTVKSFSSLECGVKAFLSYELLQTFSKGDHQGMRPIDLCYRPSPKVTWRDFFSQ
ncbi:MAG TPA: hypothetical protein VE862_09125 [Candidatus Acidoferrum sp.]|nr:hypothetical protein [Candidatus Acidoferrum sp.]